MGKKELTVLVEEDSIECAEELFSCMELSMSEAVNMFLDACIIYGEIPFKEPKFNQETIEAMEEAKHILDDPNVKRYSSVEELFEDLEREIREEELHENSAKD